MTDHSAGAPCQHIVILRKRYARRHLTAEQFESRLKQVVGAQTHARPCKPG